MSNATTVRRSTRLAAKPRVNYSEMEEAPAPTENRPTVSVHITVTEKPSVFDPVEKVRHVNYMKGMLERVVAATGDKATKAVIATELMHYIAAQCKDFCNAYPRFRDTVVSKCYEFKKFEGDQSKLIAACDTVLRMFDRPLTVPEVLPITLPRASCGECPACIKAQDETRAALEASYAKKKAEAAAKAEEEAKAKVVPVDATFLREHLRRIQGELEDAETEGYFHSLIGDYLRYVRKPEVLATLKESPSDRMIARGIIRQYAEELCEYHQEDMDDFLYLCPV